MKVLKTAVMVIGVVAAVATGVGALVGAPAFAAFTGIALSTVAAIGTLASVAGMALNMLDPPKPPGSVLSGSQTSFRLDPAAGIPYVIGRTAFAGLGAHRETWGKDNQYQGNVIVWSGGGPIQAIEQFQANREAVRFAGQAATGRYAGYMWLRSQLGLCPSPALGTPVAGFPGVDAEFIMSGFAASTWVTKQDLKEGKKFAAGLPNPLAILRGVKVYDPRQDSTYPGGSGPCRPLQEETYVGGAAAENPWCHALTWALGRWQNAKKVIGVGMALASINVASFVDAANIADANGWKVGGVVSSVDDKYDVLNMMAQAGGGQASRLGAKLTAFCDAPRVSIATISRNDLVGRGQVAAAPLKRAKLNGVVPVIRSEANGWEMVPCAPVRFAEYVAADGKRNTAETPYILVQQDKQAAELAAYEVLNSREIGPIDLPLGIRWLGLEPGDQVNVDIGELGLNNQAAVALVRGLDPGTGQVNVSLRSETVGKHDLALGKTTVVPPSPSLAPPHLEDIPAPLADAWELTAEALEGENGEVAPALVITGETDNLTADSVFVRYRRVVQGGAPWSAGGNFDPSTTRIEIGGIAPATAYEAAVAYRVHGVVGAWRSLGTATLDPSQAGTVVGQAPAATDHTIEPGATHGAPIGTDVGGRPAGQVVTELDLLLASAENAESVLFPAIDAALDEANERIGEAEVALDAAEVIIADHVAQLSDIDAWIAEAGANTNAVLAQRADVLEAQMAGTQDSNLRGRIVNVETAVTDGRFAAAGRATTLEAQMAGTVASNLRGRIEVVETAVTDGRFASASRATTLEAQMAGTLDSNLRARIVNTETAITDGRFAAASRASTLEAQMAGTQDSNLRSRIVNVETAVTDGRFSTAQRSTNLEARADTLEGQIAGTVASGLRARIETVETATTDGRFAAASRASTLEAQMAGTQDSNLRARIVNTETAVSDGRFAAASRASTLEAQMAGTQDSNLRARIVNTESAIVTLDGETTQLLAKVGLAVDVNGRIVGYDIFNSGVVGVVKFLADVFKVEDPDGGPGLTWADGVIWNRGVSQSVLIGQGIGSSQDLMFWAGPTPATPSGATKANGVFWIDNTGDLFVRGSIIAGVLSNNIATSSLAAGASVTLGPIGSNGNPIQVVASYSSFEGHDAFYEGTTAGRNDWDAAVAAWGASHNGFSVNGSKQTACTIRVYLYKFAVHVATVVIDSYTETISGNRPVPGDDGGFLRFESFASGSVTWTDNAGGATDREFTATIVQRSSFVPTSQRVAIVTSEE